MEGGANLGGVVGNLGGGAAHGAFREHIRSKRCQARLAHGISVTATENHQVSRDNRELVLFDQHHGETVCQLEAGGHWQAQMRERSRLGRICSPRLVGHAASDCAGLFSFLFLCFFCAGRIVHNFFARDPEDDGTLAWLKTLVGNALQVGGGGMVVAFQVLREITWIAEIMVVLVEAVGHAPEAAEAFQLLNDLRLNYIASAIQLGLGGSFRPQFC